MAASIPSVAMAAAGYQTVFNSLGTAGPLPAAPPRREHIGAAQGVHRPEPATSYRGPRMAQQRPRSRRHDSSKRALT
jgi:hypothetical protein